MLEALGSCLQHIARYHRSDIRLEGILDIQFFRWLLFLAVGVFLHRWRHFSLGVGHLCVLSDSFSSLELILLHFLGKYQYRAGTRDRIGLEGWLIGLKVVLVCLLGVLGCQSLLFLFPEFEWCLPGLGYLHRLRPQSLPPGQLRFLYALVPWYQNIGWDRLASELVLDQRFLLESFFLNHGLNLPFSNCFVLAAI